MIAASAAVAAIIAGSLGTPMASADTSGPPEPTTLIVEASVTLAADHIGSIVIEADDVVLDCAGHTVSGPATRASSGGIEFISVSGVTIRNCVVTGFEVNGIYGYEGTGVKLERNTVFGNANHGIHLHATRDAAIVGNTVRDNGRSSASVGIILTQGTSATIRSNVIRGQRWAGILLGQATTDSAVMANTITGSEGAITLDAASNGNVVRGNVANGNTHGIGVLASSHNVIDGNTANGNAYVGFSADRGATENTFSGNIANGDNDGFLLHGAASRNILTGNAANGNRHAGFIAWDGSAGNTLTNNSGRGNAWFDAYDEQPGSNTWYGNSFRTTAGL